jgi:hypothetical protein
MEPNRFSKFEAPASQALDIDPDLGGTPAH